MDLSGDGILDISFKLIRQYARYRYGRLANGIVHHLRRIPATGRFSPSHKTAWDEYCYDVQNGPHPDTFGIETESVLGIRVARAVDGLPHDEAAILTFGAIWEREDMVDDPKGSVDRDSMRDCLDDAVWRIAMDRDLTSLEIDESRLRRGRGRRVASSPPMVRWCPKGSRLGLGAVLVRSGQPLDRLTYLGALAERIDALVAAEDPADAEVLLRIAEENEHFSFSQRRLHEVGWVLAENSDRLLEASRSSGVRWPVSVRTLARAPRAPAEPDDETLEEFLGMLYA